MGDQYMARSKMVVLVSDVVIPLYTDADDEYRKVFRGISVGSELGPSFTVIEGAMNTWPTSMPV
jgi:uncharacterized protein YqgV (UPF0045/DUF77 family)